MTCMACGSANIESHETKISDFLVERIYGSNVDNPIPTLLLRCCDCGFAYYEKRFTDVEEEKIYQGYRTDEYQKMRQRHDIWYTPEINFALGNDEKGLDQRKQIIESICKAKIGNQIHSALDFGGDMGQKYPEGLSIENKYVYDISGVDTMSGVIGIKNIEEVRKLQFDFIMCNQVLEHIGDLDTFINTLKSLGNIDTWYYFDVPYDTPFEKSPLDNLQYLFNPFFPVATMVRHLYKVKKQGYFAPMTEHVNFFTPDSLVCLFERHGFEIESCNVSRISDVLGRGKVLSILCKSCN